MFEEFEHADPKSMRVAIRAPIVTRRLCPRTDTGDGPIWPLLILARSRWPDGCKGKKNGDTIPLGGPGYAAFLKAETEKWAKVGKAAGIPKQ